MTIEVDARTNKMILHTHNDKGELIETIDTSMPPHVIEVDTETEEEEEEDDEEAPIDDAIYYKMPKQTEKYSSKKPEIQSNPDGSIEINLPSKQ